ncbi:calmodulin-like [Portunus trituberculatus]|uniref:calmodulin-like n=1 Tax=Portunus trituberculatus TaxID=210409 RepID=UPI001E1D1933|nr:calmodulin-like [Portunus trituberculatus]XP_045126820.1 calmodulin-like [Portunus trituberculatus]XP_045126821.1 calmodulin-like [Portunus trituberculatus]XP_045126822.1 calmodulin-like [Portunus trituberculatus]
MPRRLSPSKLAEARECYAIYGNRGGIPTSELGNALRALGINTTRAEMRAIVESIGSPSSVNFDLFQTVLCKDSLPPKETPEEVKEALSIFDNTGDGRISTVELKHMMMTMGEKLSKEEVDMLIREANIDQDGLISCEQFVQLMCQK